MSMSELYQELCESNDVRIYRRAFRKYEESDEPMDD